jgi:hypothetical protein
VCKNKKPIAWIIKDLWFANVGTSWSDSHPLRISYFQDFHAVGDSKRGVPWNPFLERTCVALVPFGVP